MSKSEKCKNCENTFSGTYCNLCGEKILDEKEKSIRHFLANVFNAITFIDNKFLRTLKLMLVRPGYVSMQYIQGIRVPYIRPLSMFFIVNLIYFLFSSSEIYNSTLYTQMNLLPHSGIVTQLVESRIQEEAISINDFTIKYEQQSTSLAKLLLIIFVFITSLFLALLNIRKSKYFIDHLIVSLELNSISTLLGPVISLQLAIVLVKVLRLFDVDIHFILNDKNFSFILILIFMYTLFRIHRIVYKDSVTWSSLKSLAFIPCLFISLQIYRVFLFVATFFSI